MKRLLIALVLLFAPLTVVQSLHAQQIERITEFSANAVVDASAQATIIEKINYDFGSNQRRGIFRDIPTFYSVTPDQGYSLNVNVLSVKRDGNNEQYKLESGEVGMQRIRIGNPDVTISGEHEYEIKYTLGPVAVVADDGTSIVRLDAPGGGWSVPVEKAIISINGPEDELSRTCYQGSVRSTNQTCKEVNQSTYASSNTLNPGQTITHEVVYEPDTFTRYAELIDAPKAENSLDLFAILFFALFSTIFAGLLIKHIITRWRYKNRLAQETIYPRYQPPDDMSPADVGLLIDNSTNGIELSATLLDLAVRGYIKIKQTKEKAWWRPAEYELISHGKDVSQLKEYEKTIYNALFSVGQTISTTAMKRSTKLQAAFRAFDKTIAKRLEKKGFYKPVNFLSSNLHARMSDEGYSKWAEVEGFRLYLSVAEKDRLAFHNAPQKKPEQFSAFLPYAIALGVEEQWAKQFKDIQIDTSDWYEGRQGSNMLAAAHLGGLTSSLNTVSQSISSTSSGSAGAGGGFSGGGFSGGGGGSW